MKKLACHCGGVEAEVNVSEKGFEKIMRCNCSICKKKGYIIGVIGPEDFKLIKGKSKASTIMIVKLNAFLSYLIPNKIIYCAEKSREVHELIGFKKSKGVVIQNGSY